MAEYKRTKPNFKDALAEKAKAMAPRAEPESEPRVVKVMHEGREIEIPFRDLDEETRARVMQRAAKPKERWSGDRIIVKSPSGKMTITRDNQTDDEWKKITDDTIRQHGALNVEEQYTEPENRGRGEEWGEGTIYPDKASYEKAKAMPSGPEKVKYLKSLTDRQAERGEERSDAGVSGSTPMARMASMAQQAATGATPTDSLDETNAQINGTTGKAMEALPSGKPAQKGPVNALKSIISEKPATVAPVQQFGGDPMSVAAAEETKMIPRAALQNEVMAANATPAQMSAYESEQALARANAKGEQHGQEDLEALNNEATGIRQAITDVVTDPMGTVIPAAKRLMQGAGEMFAAGGPMGAMPPSPQQQLADPLDPVAQPPVAPPPAMGAGVSASVSGKVPGNAEMPATPAESEYERQVKQAAREGQALLAAEAGLTQEKIAKDAEVLTASTATREKLAADEQKRQMAFNEEIQRHEGALKGLQQQVLDLSKQSIDPNRFWNNKTDGQKAMAVVAGALFGFGGKGMDWLNRLDSLVQQDIQAQSADLNRKRGLLSDASSMQNNLVAMAEARGLRGKAAYDAAVVTMKENLATQMQLNAMNYAQPEARIKAEQAALAIRQDASKQIASYQQQAMNSAMDRRYKLAQINHLEAQSYAARVGAAQKGADLDKLDPAALSRLEAIDKALAAAKEARTAIKGNPKDSRLVDQLAKTWVQNLNAIGLDDVAKGVFSETSSRMSAARQGQKTVLKGIMGEAINNEDIKDTAPMWGTPGFGATTGWLDSQEEVLLAERNAIIENAKKAKRDTGSLAATPSPVRTFTPSGK